MDALFEYRNCPNCGQDDFTVLFDCSMGGNDFQEGIETVYMLWGEGHGRHVKCRNCHLMYVNPIERGSKINENYSSMGSNGASIIRGSRLRTAKAQLGLIRKYKSGASLLDIGCGEGFFLFNASKAGYATKGVELSQDAAAYARREFGLDVEAKPFEEMQIPENYFDVITMWQVLEHLPYPLTALKEIHRILKPDGLLVVATPDIGGIPAKVLRRRWWNIRRLHINQFTTKTLMDMLKNAGFKNICFAYYKESISLSMLIIPILRHLKVYEHVKDLFHNGSVLGKIVNDVTFTYPSRLDSCTMIGFK